MGKGWRGEACFSFRFRPWHQHHSGKAGAPHTQFGLEETADLALQRAHPSHKHSLELLGAGCGAGWACFHMIDVAHPTAPF